MDSNHRMPAPKAGALPLGDARSRWPAWTCAARQAAKNGHRHKKNHAPKHPRDSGQPAQNRSAQGTQHVSKQAVTESIAMCRSASQFRIPYIVCSGAGRRLNLAGIDSGVETALSPGGSAPNWNVFQTTESSCWNRAKSISISSYIGHGSVPLPKDKVAGARGCVRAPAVSGGREPGTVIRS